MARKTFEATDYIPSEKDMASSSLVLERHLDMAKQRDVSNRFFNERNLIEYIDDSTKRWNGYVPPRDDTTFDWQSRVFLNFTRNTVVSFLSKAAMNLPKVAFSAVDTMGSDDLRRSKVIDRMYQWSKNNEKGDWKHFQAALEATTKGTV